MTSSVPPLPAVERPRFGVGWRGSIGMGSYGISNLLRKRAEKSGACVGLSHIRRWMRSAFKLPVAEKGSSQTLIFERAPVGGGVRFAARTR
jgi:hypothetical protein